MRSFLIICVAVATTISTAASASVDGCAQTLLQSPTDELVSTLQLTAAQVQQIDTIRNNANQQLAQVQSQLGQTADPDQVAMLERQLAAIDSSAEASVVSVLTFWQQSQCNDETAMVEPAPEVIVATPVPAYRRPAIVRPWPRLPIVRGPMPPARVPRPTVFAPPPVRRPAFTPPVPVRRPVYAGPVVHRAPVAVVSALPTHSRWQPAPFGSHRR
jgi:hypothetical protein